MERLFIGVEFMNGRYVFFDKLLKVWPNYSRLVILRVLLFVIILSKKYC